MKDGGPAFPVANTDSFETGMTLRDWFAGQALAGIAATPRIPSQRPGETIIEAHARWAYEAADEMLKERER